MTRAPRCHEYSAPDRWTERSAPRGRRDGDLCDTAVCTPAGVGTMFCLRRYHVLPTSVPCSAYVGTMFCLRRYHVLPTSVPCSAYGATMLACAGTMVCLRRHHVRHTSAPGSGC